MADQTKPQDCPFCGDWAPQVLSVIEAFCVSCGDCGNHGPECATEAEAIAAWNDMKVLVVSREQAAEIADLLRELDQIRIDPALPKQSTFISIPHERFERIKRALREVVARDG